MGIRLAACFLIVPLAASAAAGPVEQLGRADLLPAARTDLEAALCAASRREVVRSLALEPGSSRPARISGARIAACLADPALVPVVWQAFLESKLDVAVHDPDIFERHLRTLQAMPRADVDAALLATDPGPVVDLAWNSLLGTWMAPLAEQAGDAESVAQRRSLEARALAEEVVRGWVRGLIAQPDGLVTLQTDSGDAAFDLLDRVAAVHVAELIRAGTPAEAELALELVRQRVPAGPALSAAIAERVAIDPEFAEKAADLPEFPAFRVRRGAVLHPVVGPVTVGPAGRSFAVDPRGEASPPALVRVPSTAVLAALAASSLAGWLVLLRVFPRRRVVLFRLGAVALTPLALLAVEGALAIVGFHPLIAERPSFDPTRAPAQISEELPDRGLVRITGFDARSTVFPLRPDGDRVVVFGGSSAHGTHYLAEETFAARLGVELGVEVLNMGIGGALSDQVTAVAFDAVERWSPDLLVFYLGNNDLEHLHRQAGFRAYDSGDLHARYLVDRLRVARLLRGAIPSRLLDRARETAGDAAALDEEPATEEARAAIARLARWSATRNLIRVAARAQAEGVAVLFVVQGQNDAACPPVPERVTSDCFQHALRRIAIDAAAATGSSVVDGAGAMRWHAGGGWGSADGTPGAADYVYYWDQIHPTRLGHAVLAAAIAPEARALLR